MWRTLICILCIAGASPVAAQKRFYQVVEPDGSIRLVEGDAATSAIAPSAQGKPEKPQAASKKRVEGSGASAPPTIDVDGEAYIDADTLLNQGKPASSDQKRFYILRDGAGSRIEESDGQVVMPLDAARLLTPTELPSRVIESAVRFWSWPEAKDHGLLDLSACLSLPDLKKQSRRLLVSNEVSVAIDRRARLFVTPGQVLATFAFPVNVPSDVWVSSYSVSQSRPDFIEPALAFVGDDGCISRVVTGYLTHEFAPTNQRHPERRGRVTLLADEAYVVVLMPAAAPAEEAGGRQPAGRIGIRWLELK